MRRTLAAFAALAIMAAPGTAQDMATSQGMPDGWLMRFDRPGAGGATADFQVMEPGWHVTTGGAGAAIFWQPGMQASGTYRFSTAMHLFAPSGHAEAFGLFVGGHDLGSADQQYLYFLVRQTGEYLIKRRIGSETANVVGWTASDAIPRMEPGAEGSTKYALAIAVDGSRVRFMVNGATVHTLSADEVDTDGQVGIRINHRLDVHVEPLELTRSGM